jgi:glutathione S-transferase
MKLYHSPQSSNARKIRIAAALLDIPLDLELVEIHKGAQRRPEFLALNPMGKVPVLVDGDLILTESAAILIYLAESKPGATLYPTEPRVRAEVHRWLFWGASHFSPALAALAWETKLKKMYRLGEPEPAQVKRQTEQIQALGKVLDTHLTAREWIAGPNLTLADIGVGTTFFGAAPGGPLAPFGHIQAWFGRLRALEAWKATESPSLPTAGD